jgi:hypothetical protein
MAPLLGRIRIRRSGIPHLHLQIGGDGAIARQRRQLAIRGHVDGVAGDSDGTGW